MGRLRLLPVVVALALLATACNLYAWGDNSYGQTGAGPAGTSTPIQESSASEWNAMSAGSYHSCGIKKGSGNNSLWCWGRNNYGQIGDNSTTNRSAPTQVGTFTNWKSVEAGVFHTCAIRGSGNLYCWGDNRRGQLGDGTKIDSSTPVRVGTAADWDSVTLGQNHTCGTRDGGVGYCWGRNHRGQLGVGDLVERLTPAALVETWNDIDAGAFFTCGIRAGVRAVYCWGSDAAGQIGNGNLDNDVHKVVPTPITSIPDHLSQNVFTDVSAGGSHACAIFEADGLIANLGCWGSGTYGQNGDPGVQIDAFQLNVTPLHDDWSEVTAGYNHTCGRIGGDIYCWGRNNFGQLGTGSTEDDEHLATQVGASGRWQAISAGRNHSLALRWED